MRSMLVLSTLLAVCVLVYGQDDASHSTASSGPLPETGVTSSLTPTSALGSTPQSTLAESAPTDESTHTFTSTSTSGPTGTLESTPTTSLASTQDGDSSTDIGQTNIPASTTDTDSTTDSVLTATLSTGPSATLLITSTQTSAFSSALASIPEESQMSESTESESPASAISMSSIFESSQNIKSTSSTNSDHTTSSDTVATLYHNPPPSHSMSTSPGSLDQDGAAPVPGFTQTLPTTQTTGSAPATCTPLASIESQNAPYLGNFSRYPCPGEPKSFWRLPCRGQSGIGRIDPLMDPGGPGAHVHTLSGGNGFGLNATFQSLIHSTCTSCQVKQDKSAYWTPALFFMYDNGTAVMVEQLGGMLAYYKSFANTVPFPDGFNMVAGNPYVRNFTGPLPDIPQSDVTVWKDDPDEVGTAEHQFFLMQRAIGFNCLNYYGELPAEASLYRHQLPTKAYMDYQCVDGLRLELAFPTCGNGSIDSADHKSHMKYPHLVQQGVCPTGYDTLFPLLFYETIYNTWAFAGVNGTFMLSYGDPIGTGYHGDFMMGWESEGMLLEAINECRNISGQVQDCSFLDLQSDEDQMACHFAVPDAVKGDNPLGPRNGLAVDVPIQYGPAQATQYPVAGQSGVPTSSWALEAAPKTFAGNLSIHPYGILVNPTLMNAAGGTGVINFLTTAESMPIPVGMTPLSPLSYVSGVIAPQFSRYLTGSATNPHVPDGSGDAGPGSTALPDITSPAICNTESPRPPISIATSYKTIGNEEFQVFIEDIEFVITTRTKITVTGSTSTLQSEGASEKPSSQASMPDSGSTVQPSASSTSSESGYESTSQAPSEPDVAGPTFNTIMWVLGSETYFTAPSAIQTTGGNYPMSTTQGVSSSKLSSPLSASSIDSGLLGTKTTGSSGSGSFSSDTSRSEIVTSGIPSSSDEETTGSLDSDATSTLDRGTSTTADVGRMDVSDTDALSVPSTGSSTSA